MQVNLRKANAIQGEIRKAISAVKLESSVSITEYTTDITTALANGADAFIQAIQRKEQLSASLYEIRALVSKANATVGINDVLTEVERIDAKMQIVSAATDAPVAKAFDEIHGRVQKFKGQTAETARSSLYGDMYNKVDTGVLSQTKINEYKDLVKNLKRTKQGLQDKLLTLNVSNYITLPEDVVSILQAEGIL